MARLRLDPSSASGYSTEPEKPSYKPYFAGGPGKVSLVDSVAGKHGAVRLELADMDDVTIASAPTDDQVIAYDSATSQFIPQSIAAVSGAGDVDGPASATDNAIARFDGTTGKVIQDGANSIIDDSGNTLLAGYLRVGSVSAPTNTAAGDLTLHNGSGNTPGRIAVGNNSAFNASNGYIAQFYGTLTDTGSGGKNGINNQVTIDPAGASSAEFRAYVMSAQVADGNNQTISTVVGMSAETRHLGDNTTTLLIGINTTGTVFTNSSGSSATATTLEGLRARGFAASGTLVTTGTITTARAIFINNNDAPQTMTIATEIGLDVTALTRATTSSIGVRIGTPAGAGTNYALQLSGTGGTAAGGITFGTDVQLYRSAANVLKLDDQLNIANAQNAIVLNVDQTSGSATADVTDIDNDGTGSALVVRQDGVLATNKRSLDFRLNSDLSNSGTYGFFVYSDVAHTLGGTGSAVSSVVRFHNDNASAANTLFTATQDGAGDGILIDNNNNGFGINLDHDGNTASKLWGVKITVDNAGAGGVGGIDFSGMTTDEALLKATADAITATGTISHQIPIDIGGTIFYLVAYTHGS